MSLRAPLENFNNINGTFLTGRGAVRRRGNLTKTGLLHPFGVRNDTHFTIAIQPDCVVPTEQVDGLKMTEREALIALNLIPDIGSVRLKNLREAFGSAPKIFLNSKDSLKRVDKIGDKIACAIAGFSFEGLKKN